MTILIGCGFAIHCWLPPRARLPFFLLLTATAVGALLGTDGLWLVGLGLSLIGLCHAPAPWRIRVALVTALAVALVLLRAGAIETPWAPAVMPVLAALFMFRLILYLYDLKEERTPADPWQRLAYFFLLPNVCFPLFPVIDFKGFVHGYYASPAPEIYQKGVSWMMRGVTHFLLYRLVYHLLPLIEPEASILGVYGFMAMTYGLYLKVSGLFHLIAGSLCLFGFDLPPTNNHYFLASSFSDLWRRINIYWRDFMLTVVYYPVLQGVRSGSLAFRIALASSAVFVATWFLHSYQWFWLQGEFPVTGRDLLFWGILGSLLVLDAVSAARSGRRASRGATWSWRGALGTTARTFGVFSVMSILWSLWSSDSVVEWVYRVLRVGESDAADVGWFVTLVTLVLGLGLLGRWLEAHDLGLSRLEREAREHATVWIPSLAVGLLLLGSPLLRERLGRRPEWVVAQARSTALNALDADRRERGYYEALSRSWQSGAVAIEEEDFGDFRTSPIARPTEDLRGYELVPDATIRMRGSEFRTNRWGMHDRDYERQKPPGTYRFALLGSSIVMGWGVETDETFENVIEDRWNRDQAGGDYARFEILNLSVGGYNVLQALYVAEHQVAGFEPDAVVYVVHPNEAGRLTDRLQLMLKLGARLEDLPSTVRRALEETGAHAYLPRSEFRRRMRPHRDEILAEAYRRMVEAARAEDAVPVFVLLRMTDRDFEPEEASRLTELAEAAGGLVLRPRELYAGAKPEELQVSAGDNHPNPAGHRMIADALYEVLLENAGPLGLGSAAGRPEVAE